MSSTESCEQIQLLGEGDESNEEMRIDDEHAEKSTSTDRTLSLKGAFLVMSGYTFGTTVLVTPYTVLQLGLIPWILCFIGILLIHSACNYLLIVATGYALKDQCNKENIRDVYQLVANAAYGPRMRIFSVVIMYVGSVAYALSSLLLSASLISEVFTFKDVEKVNVERIWVTVIAVLITPVMYFGNYVDLKLTAGVAAFTTLTAGVGVFANSLIYRYNISHADLPVTQTHSKHESFLISLGTLLYATTPSTVIPNITSVTKRSDKLIIPLTCFILCMALIMPLTGIVPYLAFGENILPSTIYQPFIYF